MPRTRTLLQQTIRLACSLAFIKAGIRMPIKTAMTEMTTSNSTSVKASLLRIAAILLQPICTGDSLAASSLQSLRHATSIVREHPRRNKGEIRVNSVVPTALVRTTWCAFSLLCSRIGRFTRAAFCYSLTASIRSTKISKSSASSRPSPFRSAGLSSIGSWLRQYATN